MTLPTSYGARARGVPSRCGYEGSAVVEQHPQARCRCARPPRRARGLCRQMSDHASSFRLGRSPLVHHRAARGHRADLGEGRHRPTAVATAPAAGRTPRGPRRRTAWGAVEREVSISPPSSPPTTVIDGRTPGMCEVPPAGGRRPRCRDTSPRPWARSAPAATRSARGGIGQPSASPTARAVATRSADELARPFPRQRALDGQHPAQGGAEDSMIIRRAGATCACGPGGPPARPRRAMPGRPPGPSGRWAG